MTKHVSVEPFPPGEYVQEFLDGKGWTQDDLAAVIGCTRQHVNRVLQGKTAITPDTAVALGDAFGTSPELWMNLQVSYELSMAKSDQERQRRASIYSAVPVRELVKRGWIADVKEADELEQEVTRFLGESVPTAAARKRTTYDSDTVAQQAWLRRARMLAENAPATKFVAKELDDHLSQLRSLSCYPEDARRIPSYLADAGIRLVLVEHLKGTKIDGAAFWLDKKSPAIALSLRYDRIDNLWHTLMHELIHIKRGDARPDVDVDMMSPDVSGVEKEVNDMAADALIPRKRLESFIRRVRPYFYQRRVVEFAQSVKVHPGIVVGQLHHRDKLKYNQLRKLLPRIRSQIVPSAITDGWGNTPTF